MKLWYGDIALHDLGELQILGQSSAMEPPEAPQRERRSLRIKLNFWEQSYADNLAQVTAVRAALTKQQAVLQWQDDSGNDLVNRDVTVSDDSQPEGENAQGTYRQSLVFSFWYYLHNLTTNCLPAFITAFTATTGGAAAGAALNLGAVEKWSEGFITELFDPIKDARKRLTGSLSASGRFQGDTTAPLATRRAALLATKDALLTEIQKGVSMSLQFGTFNKVVRVLTFKAEVNQPMCHIEWSITASYTAYPDESDYYWLDYTLERKLDETTGVTTLTLSGKMGATDEAKARARLLLLYTGATSVIPATNSPITNDVTARNVESSGVQGSGFKVEGAFIEITFTLSFYDTTGAYAGLAGNVLNETPLDLGFIHEWSEGLDTELFDPRKDARKRLTGSVSAKGRYTGNPALALSARQTALLAIKDGMIAEITKGAAMQFSYASFDQRVRIISFKAAVDQARNVIEWSLTATYTAYPAEGDYYWLDYTIDTRVNLTDGINFITLNGKIGATDEATARARLLQLYTNTQGDNPQLTSVIPADYVQLTSNIVPRNVESRQGSNVAEAAFVELMFTLEFRDITTIALTYQKGGSGTSYNLGTVEKFNDRYSANLFDEMKTDRRLAMGTVSAAGKIWQPDSLTLAAKRAALTTLKGQLDAAFNGGSSGALVYGAIFSQTVRVIDWDCHVNRLMNCLEWSITATYVRFPDANNYAICDFNLVPAQNLLEGTVNYSLTGRIGASSVEAAYAKLATLRTLLIPAGFANTGQTPSERRVQVKSGTDDPAPTFIELTFNDDWRKTTGNILQWEVKIQNADLTDGDVRTGMIKVAYTGSVLCAGSTLDACYATGKAQALALGDGKFPFKVNQSITRSDKLFQTSGTTVFLLVEFSFEYQVKGQSTYIELNAERTIDSFGQTVEAVSGFIAAPDLATASAAYLTNVRNLAAYQNLLLLSERTPTLSQQQIVGAGPQFDRYAFSFSVLIAKAANAAAMEYSIEPRSNLLTLEKITVVRGMVFAADAATANALVDNLTASLTIGQKTESARPEKYRQAGSVADPNTKVSVFVGLEFNETFADRLTGVAGILECEVTVALTYSATRWVNKPVPDGPDVIQNCGHKAGRRVVSGNVRATTDTACLVWAKKCRLALLTGSVVADGGPYEEEAAVATKMLFAPRVDGTTGTAGNVRVFEQSFSFQEILPQMPFVP